MIYLLIFQSSWVLCQYPYFVCPIEYSEELGRMTMDCEPGPLFRPTEYSLPFFIHPLLHIVSTIWLKINGT